MKKLFFILLMFAASQVSFASDVRISARSTVAPAPTSSQSIGFWDVVYILWIL